jgi:predicted nucleotidyltransferase
MTMNTELFHASDLIRNLIAFLDRDPNVIFAVMFGSAAAGTMVKDSDIDMAIYFRNPPEGLDLLSLINNLSDLTGRDVDVTVLNRASAFLRHQMIKTKLNLIIKDEIEYRKFREKTLLDYEEYKYVSGMNVMIVKQLIGKKLRRIEERLRELSPVRIETVDEFKSIVVKKGFIERNIKLAIEQMIGVCKHLVSGLGLKEPETYAECSPCAERDC